MGVAICGGVGEVGGPKHHLPDLKPYITSVYADWNMLIWEIRFVGGGGSWYTDQNRLGNETLADAALTWQMGNEIVGSFHCVPVSFHSSIHLVSNPPAAGKKSRGRNVSHLKLSGQLSWDITHASPKTWSQSPNLAARLTSLHQPAAHRVTQRHCHTLDTCVQSLCLCMHQAIFRCL